MTSTYMSSHDPSIHFAHGSSANPLYQNIGDQKDSKPLHEEDSKFKDEEATAALRATPKFQDIWATVLFIIQFGITIGIFIYCFNALKNPDASSPFLNPDVKSAIFRAMGISTGVGIGFSVLYMILMYQFPQQMVIGSFIATIAIWIASGIAMLLSKMIIAGVILLALALLEGLIVYTWRHRIPFSALLLENTVSVIRQYPSSIVASFIQLVILFGYIFFWGLTLASVSAKHFESSLNTFLIIYLAFSFFWTTQVFKNVLHVTISGLFATYYFVIGSGHTAKNPTLASAKRALTYSFGSVAFGSLVIAGIQTLRFVLNMLQTRDSFAGACVDCILNCVQSLAEYFNYYAYTQVAIYGKPYIQAAKDTWRLVKSSGIDVIINDNLLGNVLGIAVLLGSVISGVSGYLLIFKNDALSAENVASIVSMSAAIGAVIMLLITETIHSGYSTTIVCYCQNPEALAHSKPELYNRFVQAQQNRSRV